VTSCRASSVCYKTPTSSLPVSLTSRFTRVSPLTACAGIVLALVAAFGAAMPRARVATRERVGRTAAVRLASPRINDRLAWVAPDDAAPQASAAIEQQPALGAPARDAAVLACVSDRTVAVPPAVESAWGREGGTAVTVSTSAAPSAGRAPPLA
jgi:hypothetical protein